MTKRKSGSKCTMNSLIVCKVSKEPKRSKTQKRSKKSKSIRQPLSKLSVNIKDELRRSKRNVSITSSKEKNSVTPCEKKPLKTPLKSHVANEALHDNSVTETTKSVKKSSRLQELTRRSISFKLQNEPDTFQITGKKSRKSSCQTPKKPLKETKRALISQIELEESVADVSFGAYCDPPAASIRRSTRQATILEKSPADMTFGGYHVLAKETFESPAKKSRKTPCETPKKPLKRTKQALISKIKVEESPADMSFGPYYDPPAVSLRRSIRHASSIQIKLKESPTDTDFHTNRDLTEDTFESLETKHRKIPSQTSKKPVNKTRRALFCQVRLEELSAEISFGAYCDPPAASIRRSTRHATILEKSPADMTFGGSHVLAKETFESPAKKSRKTPCETPKKPLKRTKQALISKIKVEESPADMSFGPYYDPPTVPSRRSTKRATMSKINQEKSPADLSFQADYGAAILSGPSIRRTPTSLINLEESTSDMSFRAVHDLDKEACEKAGKKLRKTQSQASMEALNKTPETPSKYPSKTSSQIRNRTPSTRVNVLPPIIKERNLPITEDISDVQIAKKSLHVSAIPRNFPCREREFDDIYSFIETKILDESGGCMYVCGCPGTGKTATIRKVLKSLQFKVQQKKLPPFECVEINGMQLTEPRQAYVQIYRQFTGQTLPWEEAHLLLEKKFMTPDMNRKTTLLLVDELDLLCNRRQDVIYNLLDWSTKQAAKLAVVTVANAIDLPERSLKGKITSRLGLTRLTFQPYSNKQLQMIVQARLMGTSNIFDSDGVQLVARKVASISGDCRRALDICRRAIEIAERDCDSTMDIIVSMTHVQAAFNDMITNPKVLAMTKCSKYEKFFLQAVDAEVTRTGVDETNLYQVYQQYEAICALNGVNVPEVGATLRISSKLGSSRLLICEHSSAYIHQKIMLNVSHDDIYQALHGMAE